MISTSAASAESVTTVKLSKCSISYLKLTSKPKLEPHKVLLFLHNGGTSHIIYKPLIKQLLATKSMDSTNYAFYAIDLPGFGDSAISPPSTCFRLEEYVDAVDEFIKIVICRQDHGQSIVKTSIDLVGNCMGSAISLHLAFRSLKQQQSPSNNCNTGTNANLYTMSSLTLFNTLTTSTFLHGYLWPVKYTPSSLLTSLTNPKRLPRFLTAFAVSWQRGSLWTRPPECKGPIGEGLQDLYYRDAQVPCLLSLVREMSPSPSSKSNGVDVDADVGYDLEAHPFIGMVSESIPVLSIWGRQNKVLSARQGALLNKVLKPSQDVVLERAGHLVMLEDVKVVADLLASFLITD